MATVDKDPTLERALQHPTTLIGDGQNFGTITDQIGDIPLTPAAKTPRGWIFGILLTFAVVQILVVSVAWLLLMGTGVWGLNVPVGWGFAIINFVWWIGIGHAGTFISAILLLFHQKWRMSINRFAEAMTLFAVMCAGMFPLLHTGRPWFAFWLLPYPNTMELWPQFRSPLIWDVFAVTTYLTVSVVFWYVGLIPDLATMRDKAKYLGTKVLYGIFALGWRGSAIHWKRYETAYILLAGLSAPLVLSVHTVVSFDFSVSLIPGWHATIFPPYFVAGAIYSGFAMVLTLALPIRWAYKLEDYITIKHIDNMAKVTLATGLMVAYGYSMEAFMGWYSGSFYEQFMVWNRMTGPMKAFYWALIFCNVLVPQSLWFRAVRTNIPILFIVALIVNVGMWLERFVIVVTSLHRDFMPSSWGMYSPTVWDWGLFIGTIGFFVFMMLLFARFIPMIAMSEVRTLLPESEPQNLHHSNGQAHAGQGHPEPAHHG